MPLGDKVDLAPDGLPAPTGRKGGMIQVGAQARASLRRSDGDAVDIDQIKAAPV